MSAVRSSFATRLVLAATGFAALCSFSSASAAAPSESKSEKRAVLFGSSSMNDSFGHLLAADLAQESFAVVRKGVAAAGFSRPDYRDVFDIAKAVTIDANTDLVIVYLGTNDAQSFYVRPAERQEGESARIPFKDESRWNSAYEARATAFFNGLCERGAKKVAVLLPVDVQSPVMQKRLDRIRQAQRNAAGKASCATAISTSGDTGNFGKGDSALRVHDGVHMSPKGARTLWSRIKSQVIGLTAS